MNEVDVKKKLLEDLMAAMDEKMSSKLSPKEEAAEEALEDPKEELTETPVEEALEDKSEETGEAGEDHIDVEFDISGPDAKDLAERLKELIASQGK